MIDRNLDDLIKEHYANTQNALLLSGARQVGKSYAIRKYGKANYSCFIEINFIEQPQAIQIFRHATSAAELLLRLSTFVQQPLVKGDTLIFLDEVQVYPDILTWIKFLVDSGEYRYALSGSLLGVQLKDIRSIPVGYLSEILVYPLSFEEFVRAIGVGDVTINALKYAWENQTSVDAVVHQKMMQLINLYLIVGGMPAAVQTYIDSNNMQHVMDIQRNILQLYKKDIAQYDLKRKLYLQDIFDLIPSELNAQNKRFILKDINQNIKFSRSENDFLWLSDAGVALPVYNVEAPCAPLILNKQRNLFKLFQNDVGLLACQYSNGIQLDILNGESQLNFGAIYENFVAQELNTNAYALYYYNSKKYGELDFLIEDYGQLTAIEVKSGKSYRKHNALDKCLKCENFHIQRAIVLCHDNVQVEDDVTYMPIYMTMFMKKYQNREPFVYKLDISDLV
ncbi:MAG: ATP-binding protein [Paludibacteraceae bacterium]|nr:ATP-binding protein [Paludibacteraceae bacterium]